MWARGAGPQQVQVQQLSSSHYFEPHRAFGQLGAGTMCRNGEWLRRHISVNNSRQGLERVRHGKLLPGCTPCTAPSQSARPAHHPSLLASCWPHLQVIDGKSERGSHPVVRLPMKQWMLRITAYADRCGLPAFWCDVNAPYWPLVLPACVVQLVQHRAD